jgi:3-oxoacyl-[acyl-carrier-protein] synthase II
MRQRVLVTGLAPISAVGIGCEDFAAGLAEGRSGIREVQSFNPAAYDCGLAAECLDFALEDYLESEKTYLDRCSALTLAACALALEDAGVRPGDVRPERVGLVLGTAYGPLDTMWAHTQRVQTGGIRRASSVLFLHSFVNTPISLASIEFDIQGPVACFCQGLASAGAALQFGRDLVADGHADLVLAGGVDALSETLFAALNDAGCLDGRFIPGEGAGLLVLQTDEAAGEPLGELLAVGLANEPGSPDLAAQTARERAAAEVGLAEGDWRDFDSPREYGRPFGAAAGLDLCAAIVRGLPDRPLAVTVSDPGGLACSALVVRP